jgi:chromosome segregation ATPase
MKPTPFVITLDMVAKTVEMLQSEGRPITNRAVRERIGKGSFTNIQPLLKQVLSKISTIHSSETEGRFRPIISAATEVTRSAVKEASESLIAETYRLQKDLEDATDELSEFEKNNAETEVETEFLKNEVTRLNSKLEIMDKIIDESRIETNEVRKDVENLRNELIKVKIREDDWREAKNEAAIARERAAHLEGRIEELNKKSALMNKN